MAKPRNPNAPVILPYRKPTQGRDYWIVDVAPDYRYAVVGHPSRDYLWVLSRTPAMTPADHDAALARAKDTGFDTSQLEYTPAASTPATGTPAPPVTYGVSGCAMHPRSRSAVLRVAEKLA